MKRKRFTRRDFMKGAVLTGAGLFLGNSLRSCPGATDSVAQGVTPSPQAYLPLMTKGYPPTPTPSPTPTTEPSPTSIPGTPKVVHVHNTGATNWNGSGYSKITYRRI
ncbi:MAG: twin-arginine translocation signal domain-containing protein [Chloroflexota bacterium]|nr:twin-arginine translocation signal domain-containing protein [Chloroflexota bacterium]